MSTLSYSLNSSTKQWIKIKLLIVDIHRGKDDN